MQLGYEPGPIKVKGPSMLGLSKGGEFRSGVLTGYLKESGILQEGNVTKNVTAGMTMSICEVVASSLVQVKRFSLYGIPQFLVVSTKCMCLF